MQKILFITLLIGKVLMAATLSHIDVGDTQIPLIKEEDKRLPLINLQLIFTVSGSIEDGDKPGLARLSASILNEGTRSHGASKFAELLAADAIHLSAHAGTETFVVELSCLKEKEKEAFMRLKELLVDPNLTEETLKKIKTKTLGSLEAKEDDFDYIANKNLKKLLFKNTPLATPALGTKESIASITLEDIKNFLSNHLVRERSIVAIGGDIDQNTTLEIASVVETLPKGSKKELGYYKANENKEEMLVKKETQQAYIYFGSPYNLKYNDEDTYKARVATFILGTGGFGSRLMETIRVEHGLAYSAYARVHFNKSNSYFSGYMQTKLESQQEAIRLTKEVIEGFIKDGATKEELEQTKRFLLGSEPLRNETMNQRLNRAFMEYYKGFALGHSKEELKKIEALTLEELNQFIHSHNEIKKLSWSIVTK
ncbi:Zinc protease-like protein [hydrothermal vent metagenome]|uniref:Zinc protease-like protein n=1 Tax=hydrothermal vent metagenome TaxID=652676 RepID=A0A1W1C3I5_9ZZZZ